MMDHLFATFWSTSSRKWLTSTAATVSALCGAVLAVPSAWSALDLPELATRQWSKTVILTPVRTAQDQTEKRVIDLQIDLARGKLDQLDNARASLDIEKLKATDPEIKAKADSQIRKIDRDSSALFDQIRTLQGLSK
jgi:hypothetical protein